MKITKILCAVLASVLVIVLPLSIILSLAVIIPDQYENTFLGVLDDKFERLTTLEEEKIVVIGGSSVAFGLDSELLERYTGMPVVNFGLYAALGTKLMLDLSRAGIKEGDVVIISPELDPQTMSMYFNSESTLQAMDGSYGMLRYVDSDNIFSLIGAMFGHIGRKFACLRDGAPNPEGVYNSKNFNEYGDIEYERPSNVMEAYYDRNTTIRLNGDILDESFIGYLNEYVAFCERQGARVYFSFCPMNSLAIEEGTTEESIAEFEKLLDSKLDCEVISYVADYIMGPGYFYDSNFHLNEAGSEYRTLLLTRDILLALETPTVVNKPLPEEPELKSGLIMVEEYDENQQYFTYEKMENGNYRITGLTDLGKTMVELTLPVSITLEGDSFGTAVTSVGEGAFSGTVAKRIYIPEASYISRIENGAFLNAGSVRHLYIGIKNPTAIMPPSTQENGFRGAYGQLTVHVPKGSGYDIDYFWSEIPSDMTIIEDYDK